MLNRLVPAPSLLLLCGLLAACDQPSPTRPLDPADPAATATLPAPSGAARSGAWVLVDGQRKAARYLCDGLDRPQVIAVLEPDAEGRSALVTFDKADPSTPVVQIVTLGEADPGAGQIHYPLLDLFKGVARQVGALRTFNPGMLADPSVATLPTLTEVRIGDHTTRCRWIPRARMLGFTGKHSVLVSGTEGGKLAYTTFDFRNAGQAALIESGVVQSTAPSLDIEGGTEDPSAAPAVMRFQNEGYGYAVRIGADSGDVAVDLGGATIQTERLIGYAYAAP